MRARPVEVDPVNSTAEVVIVGLSASLQTVLWREIRDVTPRKCLEELQIVSVLASRSSRKLRGFQEAN